jgi:hypothetical protein
MTQGRVYTVEEANAMLPDLRERLVRIRSARQTLLRTAEKIRGTVATDGGGKDGGRDYWEAKQILGAEVAHLAELEIALRDPETGLIDFPGEREGDPVFLCWRAERIRTSRSRRSGSIAFASSTV